MKGRETLGAAAAKSGMDERTARKYLKAGRLPSQMKKPHTWRTRKDSFADVWEEVTSLLETTPGLEAKTIFEELQTRHAGKFADGQLRTLQRKVKRWRATEGPSKETFFPQVHRPGDLCETDFTSMNELGISIGGQRFDHLLFHFVLTSSNWETGTVCFSESFESLSLGLQNALWELGGVPRRIQTDRLSAAVHKECRPDEFTARYGALLRHYGTEGAKIRAAEAHENGDVEQRHYRLKRMVDQTLMLRGSRDFSSREEYETFLRTLFRRANRGRQARLEEELRVLRRLPGWRLDDFRELKVRVGPTSTIRAAHNTYSVSSRLIGEWVTIRLYGEHLGVLYGQKEVDRLPRLRGERGHKIDYRHIIDWLVRKPGAFEHYRYREDLFPTTRFRMAYDVMKETRPLRAVKEYLEILRLAAHESESRVDDILRAMFDAGDDVSSDAVAKSLASNVPVLEATAVEVHEIPLRSYDELLCSWTEA
ncbi:MAG: IS21 family transposase [Thermodesulfobacteriota bacterium]